MEIGSCVKCAETFSACGCGSKAAERYEAYEDPITDRQEYKIDELGGKSDGDMTRSEASDYIKKLQGRESGTWRAESGPLPADPRVSPLNTGLYSPSDTPEMAAEGVSKTQVQIEMGDSSGQTEGYRNRIFSVSPINEGDGSIDYLLDDLETLIEERVSGWNATYDYLLNAESLEDLDKSQLIDLIKNLEDRDEYVKGYVENAAESFGAEGDMEIPDMIMPYKIHWRDVRAFKDDDNDGKHYGVCHQDEEGEIMSIQFYKTEKERDAELKKDIEWHMKEYGAESFGAESKFDKLAKEIAEEYEEKGKSPKEAMEIGEATAAKIGRAKFGKRKFAKMGKKAEDDIDFDKSKADRNKDGRISDWERAVGNKVAKGIRESKRAEVGPHVPTRIAATTTPRGVVKTYTSIPAGDGHVIGQFTPDMDYAPSGMYGAESLTSSIEKGFGAVLGIMSGLIVGGFAMGAVSSLSKDDENRE